MTQMGKASEQLRRLGTEQHELDDGPEGIIKAGRAIDQMQIACREAANMLDDAERALSVADTYGDFCRYGVDDMITAALDKLRGQENAD